MKILLVEDDTNKMQRLANEVRRIRPDTQIVEARSYQRGLTYLMNEPFDYVLLDMSLPVFDITPEEDGFQVDPFSGRNILSEMERKSILIPTAVITMFETFGEGDDLMTLEELDKQLAIRHPSIYRGAIYYNSSEINWKDALKRLLESFQ
jgi:CheY-like chemotaxis protein